MADWLTWDDGAFTADIVTSLELSAKASVTNHTVETGTSIADHVVFEPKTVTFEFCQSSQPSKLEDLEWSTVTLPVEKSRFSPGGLLAITMAAGEALGALADAVGLGGGTGELKIWVLKAKIEEDRIQAIYDALMAVFDQSKLVAFAYQGIYLQDYLLTSVSRAQRGGSGGLARFAIEAQKIQTVATSAMALGGLPLPNILGALPLLDWGPKGTKKVTEKVEEHANANADSLGLNALGGAI